MKVEQKLGSELDTKGFFCHFLLTETLTLFLTVFKCLHKTTLRKKICQCDLYVQSMNDPNIPQRFSSSSIFPHISNHKSKCHYLPAQFLSKNARHEP